MSATKRRLSAIKKAMLGIITFAVLIFVFTLYFSRSYSDVAREGLEAIRAEDPAYAYTLMSKGFQQNVSLEAFQAYINEHPVLKDYIDLTFNDRKIENGINYLQGTITGPDGVKQKIDFEMINEDGQWKVQNMQLSPQ